MDIRMPDAHVFRFGVFEFDEDSGELRRHGLKVRLPDQSCQILRVLLSRPGEVATREELRQALWSAETFVDFEVGLNSAVRKLREALDDSADNPRFVETVPRRGYRFVASVTAPAADRAPSDPPAEQIPVPMPEMPAEQTSAPMPGAPAEQAFESLPMPAAVPAPRSRLIGWRAALLLTVGLIVVAGVVYNRRDLAHLRVGPAAEPIRSLVVLPFENLTGDPGQDYFVDNVTEAVTAHLAQVEGIDVISSTSARQYKQADKRIPEMGAELKVEGVVEGTVSRSGARVGITVKLIRAATDRNEWAEIYEEDVSRMLTLQQQIASDVGVAAGRPRPTAARSRTIDPKAYDAYIKGLTAQGPQRFEGFQRAAAYFEVAVKIQPDFAEAHAALAFVHLQFLFGGTCLHTKRSPRGRRRRGGRCSSTTRCRGRTLRSARSSSCTTGAWRKATRNCSGRPNCKARLNFPRRSSARSGGRDGSRRRLPRLNVHANSTRCRWPRKSRSERPTARPASTVAQSRNCAGRWR